MKAFRFRTAAAIVLSLGAGACEAGSGEARVEVHDSAGVRLVLNHQAALEDLPVWTIEKTPRLRLGRADGVGPEQFHRVAAALRQEGWIVVADAGSGELRWFDTAGAHVATGGGEGEGPGEFRYLSWIGRGSGGSLFAWDRRLRRLSEFRDRAFSRDVRPRLPEDRAYPVAHGLLSGDVLVATPGSVYIPENEPGVQRPPMPVWRIRTRSGELDTLGIFPGQAVNLRPARNNAWIRTEVPYGPTTLLAVRGEEVVVADNAEYELRIFGSDGALRRVARLPHEPRPVTEEDLRAELERRLESMPPVEEIRAGARASFEETPPAEVMPAFDRLLVDPDGNVWVRRTIAPGPADQREWHVVNREGALVARAVLPAGLMVTDIGADYVLGIHRDELGVERIDMHRLNRSQ